MYLHNEALALQRTRDRLLEAERCRLAAQLARNRRWERYAAFANARANRAQARLIERSPILTEVQARI
jgi:hypothetical protein